MTPESHLYLYCFLIALGASGLLTPIMRLIALRFHVLDRPITDVKTHKKPVPYLGGAAIAGGLVIALLAARFLTNFPTGTLHALRGILFGAIIVFLLGLADDINRHGLGYREKFAVQVAAALCLIFFDIRIKFISPLWFADLLTVVWVVGIINAINIIDIMDGLASGIAVIASLGFLFISLPSEAIYVNFTSAGLAGALLGFLPYNLSRRYKIFMGDTGSLTTGFVLAALTLGTSYTRVNNLAVFSPILILGLPIYDTLLVMYLRSLKGVSPFRGSRDHFALRLETFGFFREEILAMCYAASLLLTFVAYQITKVSTPYAVLLYAVTGIIAVGLGTWLARITMDA
jgi:UDP-GlcNAc:undecaprenyl-phosphate/decaprenyl-phosphate GlcNAc-1-phosphate transferase